jgi:uncharacterized protein (TIGR02147 family)
LVFREPHATLRLKASGFRVTTIALSNFKPRFEDRRTIVPSSEPRPTYRDYIEQEFAARTHRNPHYSLRAFARDLGVLPSKLSEILRHKCGLSGETAKAIAPLLRLDALETEYFIASAEAEHARSEKRKALAAARLEELSAVLGYSEIDLEHFKIISDWIHFAILELTDVRSFQSSERWIARRLGVGVAEVKDALKRLKDLGYLVEGSDGCLRQTAADLATPQQVPSREKRKYHAQIIHKAAQSIDRYKVEERDLSAMTLSFSSDQLNEARKEIQAFRRGFTTKFQKKNPKDRVYCLAIQFFPLDELSSNDKRKAFVK